MDVHVMRGEVGGVSDHFLVESKLKVCSKWNARRVTGGRGVVKVSESDKREKEQAYVEKVRGEHEQVNKRDV